MLPIGVEASAAKASSKCANAFSVRGSWRSEIAQTADPVAGPNERPCAQASRAFEGVSRGAPASCLPPGDQTVLWEAAREACRPRPNVLLRQIQMSTAETGFHP